MAIIELFIGSQRRRGPGSAEVKPSVARSTIGARTVPLLVTALPCAISMTVDCSWMVIPSRSTVSARPRASATGWIRAQCGV